LRVKFQLRFARLNPLLRRFPALNRSADRNEDASQLILQALFEFNLPLGELNAHEPVQCARKEELTAHSIEIVVFCKEAERLGVHYFTLVPHDIKTL
jgi:hypothetical protein